jgi:molybdenum cofactor biosynthesis protein B
MGSKDHKEAAEAQTAKVAILTVSDTKTKETDESGRAAIEIFQKFGHVVVEHRVLKNARKEIASAIAAALGGEADLAVTIGGTGISKKDVSVEAARDAIAKELPGFGELFRSMSAKEIGTAAMMSRATLGVTEKAKLVLALPGSTAAVRLALEGILVNELKHLLWELRRYG